MKQKLTMENLETFFERGKQLNFRYIGILIRTEGMPKPEVIINPIENFSEKIEYYKKAYDEELFLKTYKGIRIIGFELADSYSELEQILLNN